MIRPVCASLAPALTLRAAMPDLPPYEALGDSGTVRVVVSLDAESHVVATAVESSPSVPLSRVALDSARRSQYRTAYHDCKPVPSKLVFTVDFTTSR